MGAMFFKPLSHGARGYEINHFPFAESMLPMVFDGKIKKKIFHRISRPFLLNGFMFRLKSRAARHQLQFIGSQVGQVREFSLSRASYAGYPHFKRHPTGS